jgi:hypothetical protein
MKHIAYGLMKNIYEMNNMVILNHCGLFIYIDIWLS